MDLVFTHLHWEMLFGPLVGGFIALVAIPLIVRVSKYKDLVAMPNGRTSHDGAVPNLGGVAVFASLMIGSSLFVTTGFNDEFQYLFPAIIIMFFIGIKDDIANICARKKFIVQIIVSLIVIVLADVRISSFHGLFGIWDIPVLASYVFSLVVLLGIINAFNLIDGIDGLASGLGIQIALVLGFWLAFLQRYDYAVMALSLAGGLIPFYLYNVFGKKNKIFLGDTGSLLIGLVFGILAMKVLCCELPVDSKLYAEALPILVVSVMIMPLADMIRVFALRLLKGRSPFSADRHHFHHYLIDMGMSHLRASTTIIGINTLIFLLAFSLRQWNTFELGLLVFGLALVITGLPWLINVQVRFKARGKRILEPAGSKQ